MLRLRVKSWCLFTDEFLQNLTGFTVLTNQTNASILISFSHEQAELIYLSEELDINVINL